MVRLILSLIPIIILLLLSFMLGKHNATPVTVDWLFVTQQTSLAMVLAMVLVIGFALGLLTNLFGYIRLKWQIKRLKRLLIKEIKANTNKDS
ncbi:LapA family protein [Aliidiomarina haloalkalitolerans]|nr:LapA family protein [Aliidiomarina haloalkalitolerans]